MPRYGVRQRPPPFQRPRRGCDFVLEGIPILESPDLSSDDEVNNNRFRPQLGWRPPVRACPPPPRRVLPQHRPRAPMGMPLPWPQPQPHPQRIRRRLRDRPVRQRLRGGHRQDRKSASHQKERSVIRTEHLVVSSDDDHSEGVKCSLFVHNKEGYVDDEDEESDDVDDDNMVDTVSVFKRRSAHSSRGTQCTQLATTLLPEAVKPSLFVSKASYVDTGSEYSSEGEDEDELQKRFASHWTSTLRKKRSPSWGYEQASFLGSGQLVADEVPTASKSSRGADTVTSRNGNYNSAFQSTEMVASTPKTHTLSEESTWVRDSDIDGTLPSIAPRAVSRSKTRASTDRNASRFPTNATLVEYPSLMRIGEAYNESEVSHGSNDVCDSYFLHGTWTGKRHGPLDSLQLPGGNKEQKKEENKKNRPVSPLRLATMLKTSGEDGLRAGVYDKLKSLKDTCVTERPAVDRPTRERPARLDDEKTSTSEDTKERPTLKAPRTRKHTFCALQ